MHTEKEKASTRADLERTTVFRVITVRPSLLAWWKFHYHLVFDFLV